jgi:spore coat protein CotH
MHRYFNLALVFLMVSIYGCDHTVMYNRSEMLNDISIIEAFIDEDEYYNLLQNKKTNTKVPVKIIYNGNVSTGLIRSSGGGSRMHPRWSYRIDLDTEYRIEGLSHFSLSSQSLDPTMIHTTIVSRVYALYGTPIFYNKHVFLKINDQDKGLYLIAERIDQEFFEMRSMPTFEIYKAGFDADFRFDGPEHPQFGFEKELPEDHNYQNLYDCIYAVDTSTVSQIEFSLGAYIDLDSYLQYHAISSLTNNTDAFLNNYYMHRTSASAPYTFIPWDFDRAFDPDKNVGLAGDNSLFNKIIQNTDIQQKYNDELIFILDNYYREDIIFPIIDSTAVHIAYAYEIDPFLGGAGRKLDDEVAKLKCLISERIKFFRENLGDQ